MLVRRRSCGGGQRRRGGARRRSSACGGAWCWGGSMEVDDVEGPADEESSDDEDADMEEIRKLKVSCLGYMLFNVR